MTPPPRLACVATQPGDLRPARLPRLNTWTYAGIYATIEWALRGMWGCPFHLNTAILNIYIWIFMTRYYCLVCEMHVDFGYLRNSNKSNKSQQSQEIYSSGRLQAELECLGGWKRKEKHVIYNLLVGVCKCVWFRTSNMAAANFVGASCTTWAYRYRFVPRPKGLKEAHTKWPTSSKRVTEANVLPSCGFIKESCTSLSL